MDEGGDNAEKGACNAFNAFWWPYCPKAELNKAEFSEFCQRGSGESDIGCITHLAWSSHRHVKTYIHRLSLYSDLEG